MHRLIAVGLIVALVGCENSVSESPNTFQLLAGKIALNNDGKPIKSWSSDDFNKAISETVKLTEHVITVYRRNPNNPERFFGDPVLLATSEAEQTFLLQSNNDEKYIPCLDALRDKEAVRGLVERSGSGYPMAIQNYLTIMTNHAEACKKVSH